MDAFRKSKQLLTLWVDCSKKKPMDQDLKKSKEHGEGLPTIVAAIGFAAKHQVKNVTIERGSLFANPWLGVAYYFPRNSYTHVCLHVEVFRSRSDESPLKGTYPHILSPVTLYHQFTSNFTPFTPNFVQFCWLFTPNFVGYLPPIVCVIYLVQASTMDTSRPSFSKSSFMGPALGEKMVKG